MHPKAGTPSGRDSFMTGRRYSRREFLRLGALGTGSTVLAACARQTVEPTPTPSATPTQPAPTETAAPATPATVIPTPSNTPAPFVQTVISTSGWPVDVFTSEETAADPSRKALQEALQVWLENHPGVQLKKVPVNIWEPQTIAAQVAAGTDCTYLFGPTVGGGWGREDAANAFRQGLLADLTPLVKEYRLAERILPDLWAKWSENSQVDGKFFAYPLDEFTPDATAWIYRKDRLLKNDLEEPGLDWTWTDAEKIFKAVTDESQKQLAIITGYDFLRRYLNYHGADLLTEIPVPDQPWHWTVDWTDPHWGQLLDRFRWMVHRDKSIQIDPNLTGDAGMLDNFRAGTTEFCIADYRAMFGGLDDPNSLPFFAETQNLPFGDVLGVTLTPLGDGFRPGGGRIWGPLSFSPNQTTEQLALGVDLIDWMFYGKGLEINKTLLWNAIQDPRAIFGSFLYLTGRDRFAGVPAAPEDAWGVENVARWKTIAGLPVQPLREDFFPAEQNPAPSNDPFDQRFQKMLDEKQYMNTQAMLYLAENAWKAEARTLKSSIASADFRAAAQEYYATLGEYLKSYLPDFYANRYLPFYQSKVAALILPS
jgi:hypothetical protein